MQTIKTILEACSDETKSTDEEATTQLCGGRTITLGGTHCGVANSKRYHTTPSHPTQPNAAETRSLLDGSPSAPSELPKARPHDLVRGALQ